MVSTATIHVTEWITTNLPIAVGWKAESEWLAKPQQTVYPQRQPQIRHRSEKNLPAKDWRPNHWATPPVTDRTTRFFFSTTAVKPRTVAGRPKLRQDADQTTHVHCHNVKRPADPCDVCTASYVLQPSSSVNASYVDRPHWAVLQSQPIVVLKVQQHCRVWIYLDTWGMWLLAQIPFGPSRQVSTWLDTFDQHFGCVELVELLGSTHSTGLARLARHARQDERDRRDS